jgi:hypothetical protein
MYNLKKTRENLKIQNEKLEAELVETTAKMEQLKIKMQEAEKTEVTRHAKDLDDRKKAKQIIYVRVARPTHTLFH